VIFCFHLNKNHGTQATSSKAAELCAKRDMKLVSLESKEETERIAEYTKTKRETERWKHLFSLTYFIDVSTFLTSLTKVDDKNFKWLGEIAADFVQWAPGQPSASYKCGACGSLGVSLVDCDSASNFVCEKER
jgi:hypothetical protein